MALEQLFPSLLIVLFSFAVGTFILFKSGEKANRLFAVFCYGLFIQSLFAGFLYIADNPVGALQLDLISVVGIIIAIASFVHFTAEFSKIGKVKEVILIINYTIAFIFVFLTFTGKIFSSVAIEETGYTGVAGSLFNLFTGYLFLALLFCVWTFIISFATTKSREQKNRIKYILASISILGITALLDMLRKLDVFTLTDIDLTRFGIFIFLIGISYTIIKYRLLNINFVLKKSIVFGLAMVISAILYILIEKFFDKYFELIFGSALGNASVFAALFIALFFDKIKDKTALVLGIFFQLLFKKEVTRKKRKKGLIKEVEREIKREIKKKK